MKPKKPIYSDESGFKIPENYFESFESRLMANINAEETLNNYKSKSGFEVPAAYFDNLDDQILNKVKDNKPKAKLIRLPSRAFITYASSIAAVMAIIIFSITPEPAMEGTEVSVELNAIEEYLDQEYLDLNLNDYSTFMEDDGFVFDDFKSSNLNKDAVLDYLNENVEDPGLILE
jgi:hypothetical protein